MKILIHYFRHLIINISMSFKTAVTYRVDFYLRIIRSILEITLTIILVGSLFGRTDMLGQWQHHEVLLISALTLLIVSLVMFFFGNGIENLHDEIIRGTLDRLLLQPMNTLWLASTRRMYVTNSFRVLFNITFFVYLCSHLSIDYHFTNIALFIISFGASLVIYFSLMFMASSISFWSFNGDLFYIFHTITSIAKYPLDIFNSLLRIALTVFPVIFLSTVPASALLGHPNILIYLSPVVATFFFYLTQKLWRRGLLSYNSASS